MRVPSINEFPVLPPGTCYTCGASNSSGRKWYLDCGVDVDYVGVLYVCQDCFATLARHTGEFYSQEELDVYMGMQQAILEDAEKILNKYKYLNEACATVGINVDVILENYENSMKPRAETNDLSNGSSLPDTGISEPNTERASITESFVGITGDTEESLGNSEGTNENDNVLVSDNTDPIAEVKPAPLLLFDGFGIAGS